MLLYPGEASLLNIRVEHEQYCIPCIPMRTYFFTLIFPFVICYVRRKEPKKKKEKKQEKHSDLQRMEISEE